jgi:hypothetical protein
MAMHNHIGIVSDMEIGRLVGFAEDQMDYYHIVRYMKPTSTLHRRDSNGFYTAFHSMVGSFISLKDIYGDRYDHMDTVFAMNGAPPSGDFIIKVMDTNLWFDDEPVGNELI